MMRAGQQEAKAQQASANPCEGLTVSGAKCLDNCFSN